MARLEDNKSIIVVKSKLHKYHEVSEGFSRFCGFSKPQKVQGLDDYQVAEYAHSSPYYGSDIIAEEFISEDEIVLRGGSLFIFDTLFAHGKVKFVLVHKSPHIENNKISGCFLHAIVLSQLTKPMIKTYLSNPEISISGHTKKYLDVLQLAPIRKSHLTQRELQCLRLLVQGDSAKIIATKLGLSSRTVEFYIRKIKDKFNVRKISEIVALALSEDIVKSTVIDAPNQQAVI